MLGDAVLRLQQHAGQPVTLGGLPTTGITLLFVPFGLCFDQVLGISEERSFHGSFLPSLTFVRV
jgi:hypothetical protein